MTVLFMRAYTELLVRTCHKRGAHAIGGMAAVIPSKDPQANEAALAKVRADKQRGAGDGFDGSWVARPGLVPVCREVFDGVLGDRPHQQDRLREEVSVTAADLLAVDKTPGQVTEDLVRSLLSAELDELTGDREGAERDRALAAAGLFEATALGEELPAFFTTATNLPPTRR